MPNWVTNTLVINGEAETLKKIEEQLQQPYRDMCYDYNTNAIVENTVTGKFLMWNIVKPENLHDYYEMDKLNERVVEATLAKLDPAPEEKNKLSSEEIIANINEAMQNMPPLDFDSMREEFERDVNTKQDWYHWNIRNWGTKWEVAESQSEWRKETELAYLFDTAWSPPAEAVMALSRQYPEVQFSLWAIDEGDCFAVELYIQKGEIMTELEVTINHETRMKMSGFCWACDFGDEEAQLEYKCAEFLSASADSLEPHQF